MNLRIVNISPWDLKGIAVLLQQRYPQIAVQFESAIGLVDRKTFLVLKYYDEGIPNNDPDIEAFLSRNGSGASAKTFRGWRDDRGMKDNVIVIKNSA